MSFDFPATPIEDQVYAPAGGPSYIWKSPSWRVNSTAAPILKDARRNRVVNGAMQVSQENGNTAGTTTAYYGADQFATVFTTTGTFTTQRVQSVTPNGSKDRFRLTITSADASLAAGDVLNMTTIIEGSRVADFRYGSASARQSVLRFGWKSPAGTYSFRIANSALNRSYIASFTISAGQANTDTEQAFVIPGDTSGTWLTDTGPGFVLTFAVAAGTTFQGAVGWQAGNRHATSSNTNGAGTASSVFELYDAGLYLDADNSGVAPKWEMPDEADELIACKRYYWKSTSQFMIYNGSTAAGGVGASMSIPFPVQMRVAPAVTVPSGGASNSGTATVGTISPEGCVASASSAAAGAFYNFVFCYANARM
jgi:hypothetical protein